MALMVRVGFVLVLAPLGPAITSSASASGFFRCEMKEAFSRFAGDKFQQATCAYRPGAAIGSLPAGLCARIAVQRYAKDRFEDDGTKYDLRATDGYWSYWLEIHYQPPGTMPFLYQETSPAKDVKTIGYGTCKLFP